MPPHTPDSPPRAVDLGAPHDDGARLLDAIIEQSRHFFAWLDGRGGIVRAGQARLAAIQSRMEDVAGCAFADAPWWRHDTALQQRIHDAVTRAADGETVCIDAACARSDGNILGLELTIRPVVEDGRVHAMVVEANDVSDRRAMERALRESEEKLARVLAASPDAIAITDFESGRMMDVNSTFERVFEWPRGEAVGRTSLELRLWANEHDRARFVQELARAGRVRDFVIVGRSRTGRLSRCSIAGEVVELAGQKAIILVVRDITEQTRVEQALREGEERLRLVIENAPDAIIVLDGVNGAFLDLNAEALKLFHGTRAALLGCSIADLSPACQPDGRSSKEAARFQLMKAMAGGRPVFEWTHRTLDGRDVPCEVRLMRLPSPDAVLVRGSITDLSERKRTEHAFRVLLEGTAGVSGQAFFDTTVARLGRELGVRVALVAELDAAGSDKRVRCLARWYDGPGRPCECEVLGSLFEEVMKRPVLHIERGVLGKFPSQGFLVEMQAESVLALPILDRDGAGLGVVAILDDKPMPESEAARLLLAVSAARAAVEIQHRRADEAIHRLNSDLERRVAERTAQLAAANAELESFSYSVSRDLRSPLRALDGFSRALEEDCAAVLTAEGRDYLGRIRAASQRMDLLIDDMLRLSRASRVEMNPVAVDLTAMVEKVVAELRQRDPARVVHFVAEPGLSVVADRALLEILVQNLADNAWKYTRRVSPAEICFGRAPIAPQDGEAAVFMLKDNGAGFDMRYAGKLFSPFQRLHGSAEFEGTGIGLATVQRIVTRHGGRVWIEGAVGHGATVYFTFGTGRV